MKRLLVLSAIGLVGCATPAQLTRSQLNGDLDELVGQPIEVAVVRLGQPDGQIQMGNDLVYGWRRDIAQKIVATTSGVRDNQNFLAPFYGQVNATVRDTVIRTCEVRLIVGTEGLITGWQYSGDASGCASYTGQLG